MPLYIEVRTGCHYLIGLSVCLSVCVTFVVFIDCESCTRPISTNPGSMEAGEHGLTCIQARPISTNPRSMEEECEYGLPSETCFTARRLEVVAVAGLLWIYFVVCFLAFGGIS